MGNRSITNYLRSVNKIIKKLTVNVFYVSFANFNFSMYINIIQKNAFCFMELTNQTNLFRIGLPKYGPTQGKISIAANAMGYYQRRPDY